MPGPFFATLPMGRDFVQATGNCVFAVGKTDGDLLSLERLPATITSGVKSGADLPAYAGPTTAEGYVVAKVQQDNSRQSIRVLRDFRSFCLEGCQEVGVGLASANIAEPVEPRSALAARLVSKQNETAGADWGTNEPSLSKGEEASFGRASDQIRAGLEAAASTPMQDPPEVSGSGSDPLANAGFAIRSRLGLEIDGAPAGDLDYLQTANGLSVRLGSIVAGFGERYDAAEIERLRASSAWDAFLPIADLRAKGIPLRYDPIADRFALVTSGDDPSDRRDLVDEMPDGAGSASPVAVERVMGSDAEGGGQDRQGETARPQDSNEQMATTGPEERVATLPLSVSINEREFLPILASITSTRVVAVNATDMVRTLGEVVDDNALDRIVALGDRMIDVAEFADLGILVSLNAAALTLEIAISPELLRGSTIKASQDLTFSGVERVLPSDFSLGLTGALIATAPLDNGFDPRTLLGFSGFVNIGGVDGINIDYGGDLALNGNSGGRFFQRDRIVAFKDWPEKALRISAGDLLPTQARLAGAFDVAGISLERNYEELQPIRNIRPTAARSLRLDRRSIVEVYVNDVLVERFFAEPGPLDIEQIPLAAFSNNVQIVVEDSLGRREVDNFVFGSDITLLAEGIDQFNLSFGFLRNPNVIGFNYSDTIVGSAFYERGVTSVLTLAGHAVVTSDQQNLGAAAAFSIPFGTITTDFAFSNDTFRGTGTAAGATFRGSPFFGPDKGEFATLTFDYRSRDFTTVGEFGLLSNIKFDLRAEYQVNVSDTTAVFASANYSQLHDVEESNSFYSAGVRQNFGGVFVTLAARYAKRAATGGEFGALVTLTVPLGRRNAVTATYDTASSRGRAEFRRQRGLQLPEVDYRFGVSTDPGGESVFGSLGYANSRFEADADVATRFGLGGGASQTVATARLQTGIGFSGGEFAIGRDPSRGFAILSRHPSIEDATLTARTSAAGRELAIANAFGEGLFPINAPYRPQQVSVEAADLPMGYNIGAGRYLLESGARSGHVIGVGTDNFRTLVTRLTFEAEPVSLEYGRYRRVGEDPSTAVTFFTNRSGRAALSDLAPGEYLVEFPTLAIEGRFTIEKDADALVRIEELEMKRR